MRRRDFLKNTLCIGTGAVLGDSLLKNLAYAQALNDERDTGNARYKLAKAENILNTVCLQCNTGCPIKVKLLDGLCVKIDGNPYAPWSMAPHIPYNTPVSDTATVEGAICPKGQAGLQSAYDPYRIRKVLKRAGKRGEGKWQTIDFHQAIHEIVEGGRLFSNIPGEEERHVEGLRSIYALTDRKIMDEMGKAIDELWHSKTPDEKKERLLKFKEDFKEYIASFIDSEHPDFGPKNNQLLWVHGRLKGGRSEFFKRFIQDSFGSVNFHGHTTVCQGSLYFTGKAMSEQFVFDEKSKKAKWTGGKKFYWQGDLQGAEFVIFVGASPFEANYGPPYRAKKLTEGLIHGRLKFAVVDPRLSKTAAKAYKWLPVKPGLEGALALGMIRWIIENRKFEQDYLENANQAAAREDREPTWSNACWLIKIDKEGRPGEFLRGSDIGIEKPEFDNFVTFSNGAPIVFDPNSKDAPIHGETLVDTTLNGIRVKSSLQVLYEESARHTIEEWAKLCGIKKEDIEELAKEFTSHGKRACADIHRGVSQHTHGFYNVLAWYSLNLLLGNFDYRGGMVQASTYDYLGEKAQGPFDFKNGMHPSKAKPFGISIIRHETKYEETTIFKDYPAKRPWFPLSSDVYQELIPSAGDGYPYPVKILLMYMGTPCYSLPAGQTNIEILSDTRKIPLFIASDIMVGGTSMFADYIFPDISPLERWEFQGSHPSILWKAQPVRQPVIGPITETVRVFGEEMPISLEAFILAVAEKMNLPGFGKNGFGSGLDFIRPEDFYLKMVANIAFGENKDGSSSVLDVEPLEKRLFFKSRGHLPASVFDPIRWEKTTGPLWDKVIYVLNRGGRFQNYEDAFDGDYVKNRYGKQINLYLEKTAKTKNSMTGKAFSGIATYQPAMDCLGRTLASGKDDEFHLITHREISQTKERTMGNYWLLGILPENHILINTEDASRLGLKTGDSVIIISDSNPSGVYDLKYGGRKQMIGKIKAIEGIRPGVVSFCLGFGHWANGARGILIDGKTIKGDPRRGQGIHANAAMAIDPFLKNTCLEDIVGGSASFYDSYVRLKKI